MNLETIAKDNHVTRLLKWTFSCSFSLLPANAVFSVLGKGKLVNKRIIKGLKRIMKVRLSDCLSAAGTLNFDVVWGAAVI